jgi:SCF-associated factor 1
MVGGRLGLNSRDVPQENLVRRGFQTGVAKPTKVPHLDFILADVTTGGFSCQILTSHGEIYSLGNWHCGHKGPGPDDADFKRLRSQHHDSTRAGILPPPDDAIRSGRVHFPPFVPGRLGGRVLNPTVLPFPLPNSPASPVQPPHEDETTNKFLNREFTTDPHTKFVSVSSGRCHFVAMDNSGQIWSWDDPRTGHGVNIQFFEQGSNLISQGHKVLRCLAGWNSSVAYLYQYGLIYWSKRSSMKEGDSFSVAQYHVVPETSDINGNKKILDFVVGDGFLVYLTLDGKLYRNDMIGAESYPLDKFDQHLRTNAESLQPKFTRLSGNFSTFACFTNEDLVLIGDKSNDEPIIIDELQHKECISIAVGDYHFLALCRDGSLYSWGLESRSCGCLGLGGSPVGSEMENGSTRVRKPTLVPTQGKVIAISAAGWQSSAIITDEA